MKLLAAAGLVICIAFVVAGTALKGGAGAAVTVIAAGLSVVCLVRVLGPAAQGEIGSQSTLGERRFLARVVLWAFLGRAACSLLLHVTGWWSYLGGDEETFDRNGQVFYMYLNGDLPFSIGSRLSARDEVAYPYLVGAIYYAFGISKAIPLFINCVIGAAAVFPVHALAGRMAGRIAARRAALLVAFFPSLVLWSSLMVRDCWVLLFIAGALYFAERVRRRFSLADLAGVVLCCGLLGFFRSYILFVVVAAIVGAWLLGGMSLPKAVFTGGTVMVGLILALRTGAVSGVVLDEATLENLAVMRHNNSLGPSLAGSLGTADVSTPTAALSYLPLGLLYFYFSPLPWQVGSPRQVLAVVDLLLWYSCLPAIFFGMAWLLRHRFRSTLPLLFTVIGISVLYALVEGNIGIIFRHRAQIIVPLCAVAGVGYALKKRAQRKEARIREGAVPLDPAARSALGAPEGVRLSPRAS